MSRFSTLLRREWLQHHRGWLLLMALPLLLVVGGAAVAPIEFQGNAKVTPLLLHAGATVVVTGMVWGVAWIAMLFQMPGLARRDEQDRSIEFWLSLPAGHVQSIAAPLLYHVVLMPTLALAAGFVASQLVGALLVAREFGFGAWLGLPWATLVPAGLAGLARLMFGLLLFNLWLSPVVLLLMTASAWLKRWGVPALAAASVVGGLALQKLYHVNLLSQMMLGLLIRAGRSLIDSRPDRGAVHIGSEADILYYLGELPGWALHDAALALRNLADPVLVAVLLTSGLCFAALVLRRKKAA